MRKCYGILLLLAIAMTSYGDIIAPARRITWDPGVRGGIPTDRTQDGATVTPGITIAALNARIANCPADKFILMAPGTYTFGDRIIVGKSGVTLRGSGMGVTIINAGSTLVGNPSADAQWTNGTARNLTASGLTKGSTTINTQGAHGWVAGDYIMIDQLGSQATDPPRSAAGVSQCNWCGRESGARAVNQWVKIVATPTGTSATIDPPLYFAFSTAQQVQGYKVIGGTVGAGIENLTINNQAATHLKALDMNFCISSWVYQVELIGSNKRSMQMYGGLWNTVKGCKFHEGTPAYTPPTPAYKTDRAYGLFMGPGPTACLVEDNQFYNLTVGVALEGGTSGNVVAYNVVDKMLWQSQTPPYAFDTNVGRPTILNHGGHGEQNLVEGNWVEGRFGVDSYWGTGAYYTVYRNRIKQQSNPVRFEQAWTVDIEKRNWYNNVVGNILGADGVEQRYSLDGVARATPTPGSQYTMDVCSPYGNGPRYLYRLGQAALDGNCSDIDPAVRGNTYIHGNWDYLNDAQIWNSGNSDHTLPDSLYLSSRPSWFGNRPWPPFDPANPGAAAITNIPAGCRYTAGCISTGTPSPTPTATATVPPTPAPTPTPNPAGVLRVLGSNPRYFTIDNITAKYLTGSHTWNNVQIINGVDESAAFTAFCKTYDFNFIRLWMFEHSKSTASGFPATISPLPWARSTTAGAADGGFKFNLDQFDQNYFDRLRAACIAAQQQGIYVSVMLFDGFSTDNSPPFGSDPWLYHPFKSNNNINGVDGTVAVNGTSYPAGTGIHAATTGAISLKMLAYIRKVVDTVNDLDNVVYEVINETQGPIAWQNWVAQQIKSYEATKPLQHLVGMNAGGWSCSGCPDNNALSGNVNADFWAPNATTSGQNYLCSPNDTSCIPVATGKTVTLDTDHIFGVGGDRNWVWKAFMRGTNPIYMDTYLGHGGFTAAGTSDNNTRLAMN